MNNPKPALDLLPEEKIYWTGSPALHYERSQSLLWELLDFLEEFVEILAVSSLVLFLSFCGLKEIIPLADSLLLPALIFGCGSILYLCDFANRKNFLHIKYTLTNKRIIFQSWDFFKGPQVNSIALDKIQQVSLEEQETGSIHFIETAGNAFEDKQLKAGANKPYPSFKHLEDAEDLIPTIEALLRESRK